MHINMMLPDTLDRAMTNVRQWRALARAYGVDAFDTTALLTHALKCNRAWLIAHDNDPLTHEQHATIERLMRERAAGTPVAYLVGEREFYGMAIRVTPAVLIPRPETELLVDFALKRLPRPAAGRRVLDLCTGSGCVAVAIAAERPAARVFASDVSEAAAAVARGNALRMELNVDVRVGDLFAPWVGEQLDITQFDVIVANPPYIAAGDTHLQQGDLRFEPRIALTDSADGLQIIQRIVHGAPQHLAAGGWIAIEHGYDQAAAVRELLAQRGFDKIASERDLAGIERISVGRWGSGN
jgi:release factor glutamine methyltransferase